MNVFTLVRANDGSEFLRLGDDGKLTGPDGICSKGLELLFGIGGDVQKLRLTVSTNKFANSIPVTLTSNCRIDFPCLAEVRPKLLLMRFLMDVYDILEIEHRYGMLEDDLHLFIQLEIERVVVTHEPVVPLVDNVSVYNRKMVD